MINPESRPHVLSFVLPTQGSGQHRVGFPFLLCPPDILLTAASVTDRVTQVDGSRCALRVRREQAAGRTRAGAVVPAGGDDHGGEGESLTRATYSVWGSQGMGSCYDRNVLCPGTRGLGKGQGHLSLSPRNGKPGAGERKCVPCSTSAAPPTSVGLVETRSTWESPLHAARGATVLGRRPPTWQTPSEPFQPPWRRDSEHGFTADGHVLESRHPPKCT